jgi:hypothetical protein
MEWLIGGLIGGALLVCFFALALGRASRNVRTGDERTIALTQLSDLRSPSGKPFYPNENSLWELAERLEELEAGLRQNPDPRGP